MPKLTKKQLEEIKDMKPIALNVIMQPQATVNIITINHWEVDEVVVKVDDNEPRLYKLREDKEERVYWSDGGLRYYLDDCVRYGSAWLPAYE